MKTGDQGRFRSCSCFQPPVYTEAAFHFKKSFPFIVSSIIYTIFGICASCTDHTQICWEGGERWKRETVREMEKGEAVRSIDQLIDGCLT